MIGQLSGKIISKNPPQLLIDVNGVGYEVQASMQTFFNLPELNQSLVLHTHLVVREDAQLLYGFSSILERSLFRLLIKISGVGPKLALAILSTLDPNAFVQCVEAQDTASLVRIPGVGKKTAERLIIEMRDKCIDPQILTTRESSDGIIKSVNASSDAISALVALGYKPQQAQTTVQRVAGKQDEASSEVLIKEALRELAEA